MWKERAGVYQIYADGSRRFIPKPLPPDPPINLDNLTLQISRADTALARLDGATLILPNPDLLVYSFMRQEAVLSSQIEGTQASLEDLLEFETDAARARQSQDVREVVNYISAMNWGVEEIKQLPVCLRVIKGLHARLLATGRGSHKQPGEFRDNQNWIGAPNCPIHEATYVPPPVPEMLRAVSDWENYVNAPADVPALVKCAIMHAQFETIHPFWDGNGRIGRMIITFYLCSQQVLSRPILYLSLYFKQNREEYYTRLQDTRDSGNWEDWIHFFLRGVELTSDSALRAAQKIIGLRETVLDDALGFSVKGTGRLAEALFKNLYISVTRAAKAMNVSYPTAKAAINKFADAGYLKRLGPLGNEQLYAFQPYLDILNASASETQQRTSSPVVSGAS